MSSSRAAEKRRAFLHRFAWATGLTFVLLLVVAFIVDLSTSEDDLPALPATASEVVVGLVASMLLAVVVGLIYAALQGRGTQVK